MKLTTTMLIIWVAVVFGAFTYDAFGDEVEFRVTDMTYTWGDNHSFPVTLYQVGYTKYVTNDVGLRLMAGESTKASDGHTYSSRMTHFFTFNVHRRVRLSQNISFQYGVNYSEYKEHGKPDTGTGYAVAVQYKLNPSVALKLSYDEYYEKYSEHYGLEETKGLGLSVVGVF